MVLSNGDMCYICGNKTNQFFVPANKVLCDKCQIQFKKYWEKVVEEFIEEFNPIIGFELEGPTVTHVYLTRFQPFLEFLRDYKGKKIIGLTQDSWGLYIALDLGWTKLMVHVPPEAILEDMIMGD